MYDLAFVALVVGVVAVEVERMPIAGGAAEDDVVGFGQGAAPMVDQPLTDGEVLVQIAFVRQREAVKVRIGHG